MIQRFWAVLVARNKEFLRDRGALAWNLAFPLVAVFGMAFAFSGKPQAVFKVAVIGDSALPAGFAATPYLSFVPYDAPEDALAVLRRHQVDLAVEAGPPLRYWINSSSPKGGLVELVMLGTDAREHKPRRAVVEGREIRYVDWLIAGLLGMNMMFSALFSVGHTIVRYRKTGVLRRYKATPLRACEFLAAQVCSRIMLNMAVLMVVYFGADFFLHFQMLGSYLTLFLVLGMGSVSLISLGLLIAARVTSEELAGGLLNLMSWPMIFFSGVWFSLEGAPRGLRAAAQVFPLTHTIDAARAVMTEGAGLVEVSGHLAVLAAMSALFLALGSYWFRWE